MVMYELTTGRHRILSHTCLVCVDNVHFLGGVFFVGKIAEAVNAMQTLCWAPAVEYPIKKH